MDRLELEQLEAEAAAAGQSAQPASPAPQQTPWNTNLPVPTGWGGTMMVNPSGGVVQAVKNAGIEGSMAAAGQALGAPLGPLGVGFGGSVLGGIGNAIGQLTTPSKDFSWGEVGGALATDWLPGASLAKAGGKQLLKEGAKYGAANVLGANIKSLGETGKLASPTEDALAAGGGVISPFLGKAFDQGLTAGATRTAALAKKKKPHLKKGCL